MTQLEAYHPSLEGSPTTLDQTSSTQFHAGGWEEKSLIEATVGDHEVSLVKRHYDPHYIETWQAFREAGLPVVPTLRLAEIDGYPSMLMTDLKVDGSELYGSGLAKTLRSGQPRVRPPDPNVDGRFLELTTPDQIEAVRAKAKEYAHRATQYGIKLPSDDAFELHIHPGGEWGLITLDLALGAGPSAEPRTPEQAAKLAGYNDKYTNTFLERIDVIREAMGQR
jgi:hypothetical protein